MLSYLAVTFLILHTCLCDKKPNFVIFLTDDQDVMLDGMKPMENVQRFIGSEGTTFTNSYVASPICCPSRASLLSGLHVHNHGTVNNSLVGGCNSRRWKRLETRTFGYTLKSAGYNTFYAGKYLNEYGVKAAGGPEVVPPGWMEWHGLVGNSVYYNYTLSNNGVPTYSSTLYLTDVIRELGVSYIEKQTESKPFLMVLAPPAPHQPFTPARRHIDAFRNVTAVRHPNFNIASKDKHWLISMPPSPLPESMMGELDRVFRSRWESLLAVDEMVADVIETLNTNNLLEDTYLIYTSDNGYHIGQFSQVYDKRQPYETDIKVPLLIRGPNIERNKIDYQPILNVDLAPTIIELAGLTPSKSMDGRPINFKQTEEVERKMLVEYSGEGGDGTVDHKCPWAYDNINLAQCHPQYDCKCQDARNNTFGCVRCISKQLNYKFCEFVDAENFQELYDLSQDPYELNNIIEDVLPSLRNWYKFVLNQLRHCKGADNCNNPIENAKRLSVF